MRFAALQIKLKTRLEQVDKLLATIDNDTQEFVSRTILLDYLMVETDLEP